MPFALSGLLSRGFHDKARDFIRMGDNSETWLAFSSMVLAPIRFCHEALKVRVDGAVFS